MQTQLFGQQLTLSSIFPSQPVLTAAAKRASEERTSEIQREIMEEIADRQERIAELREEILDDEQALTNAELDELDLEPCGNDEDIYSCDCIAPQLEEDLAYTRYENEAEIRALECEIAELEARLKHAN